MFERHCRLRAAAVAFTLQADKAVTPSLRQADYPFVPFVGSTKSSDRKNFQSPLSVCTAPQRRKLLKNRSPAIPWMPSDKSECGNITENRHERAFKGEARNAASNYDTSLRSGESGRQYKATLPSEARVYQHTSARLQKDDFNHITNMPGSRYEQLRQ
jgi:hypothetical protein